jgi:RNA methyltransferase, TrmH family
MPRVTSRDNPRLTAAVRLIASSRDRRKSGRCVLEGEHLVSVYIHRIGLPETLVVVENALERPAVQALLAAIPAARALIVPEAAWRELAQIPPGVGVLAVIAAPVSVAQPPGAFCLLLEDVQDPGNVGSILRTAAAAAVDQVLLSPSCAFAWSPKVLRAGQGAHFHVSITEGVDLVRWAADYDGTVAATVAAGGVSVFDAPFPDRIAIALGNEGTGVTDALLAAAPVHVTVPMPGRFESLNVAAAAAVCLYECVRQRGGAR